MVHKNPYGPYYDTHSNGALAKLKDLGHNVCGGPEDMGSWIVLSDGIHWDHATCDGKQTRCIVDLYDRTAPNGRKTVLPKEDEASGSRYEVVSAPTDISRETLLAAIEGMKRLRINHHVQAEGIYSTEGRSIFETLG